MDQAIMERYEWFTVDDDSFELVSLGRCQHQVSIDKELYQLNRIPSRTPTPEPEPRVSPETVQVAPSATQLQPWWRGDLARAACRLLWMRLGVTVVIVTLVVGYYGGVGWGSPPQCPAVIPLVAQTTAPGVNWGIIAGWIRPVDPNQVMFNAG